MGPLSVERGVNINGIVFCYLLFRKYVILVYVRVIGNFLIISHFPNYVKSFVCIQGWEFIGVKVKLAPLIWSKGLYLARDESNR